MRHYHSREQSDKRRLHLHKGEANDSKGHLSIMWSFRRGSPDDLSDDSTFFLAWLPFKHFSALKSKVIRLWKGGQWTSNGDSWHTIAVLSKYMYEIGTEREKKRILHVIYSRLHVTPGEYYRVTLLGSLLRVFMQQGYSKLPKGNSAYNSVYVPSVNAVWHLLRIIISKERVCVSLPCA